MTVNFSACSKEVVCVSIGANLLLPIAHRFTRCLLDAIETDVERIIKSHLNKDIGFCTDADLQVIGTCAELIKAENIDCAKKAGLGWRVFDVAGATVGVLFLWTGLASEIGGYSILLFLPVLSVSAVAVFRSLRWYSRMRLTIWCVKWFVHIRRRFTDRLTKEMREVEDNENILNTLGANLDSVISAKPTAHMHRTSPSPPSVPGRPVPSMPQSPTP